MTHYYQNILVTPAKRPRVQRNYYAIVDCEIGTSDPQTCKHNMITSCMVMWNNARNEIGNILPPSHDFRAAYGVPPLQPFALFLPNDTGDHAVCNLCGSINLDRRGWREWDGKGGLVK